MKNSQKLIEHLSRAGVTTFFGVQGGGSVHLIEAVCQNDQTTFIPSLNEQAAGFSAHGHFFGTGKSAGAISTCGPGFFNMMTGIAVCYYDNIPAVFLVGQVSSALNLAKNFGVKMYGFQEVPHSEIASFISEKSLKVGNDEQFSVALRAINEIDHAKSNGPLVIELQDDFQRMDCVFEGDSFITKMVGEDSIDVESHSNLSPSIERIVELLKKSARPLFMVGGGVSRASQTAKNDINTLSKSTAIPTVFTWGGQRLYNSMNEYHVGLFGGHSPGIGNSLVQQSDSIVAFGASLLQHQAGKDKGGFAPDAEIIMVNRDRNEAERYRHDFGDRLSVVPNDCADLLHILTNHLNENGLHSPFWEDIPNKNGQRDWSCGADSEVLKDLKQHAPVKSLRTFLEKCPSDYWVYSDVGATLSWTYQAATQCDAPPITSAFNLHTMGYSLPAAIGAAAGGSVSGAFAISGDGGFMMNIQELAVAKNMDIPVKILLLDNKGYGIIRQTQNEFLGGRHFGSDIGEFPSLPEFGLEKLTEAFGFETLVSSVEDCTAAAEWLFEERSMHRVVIVSIDPAEGVKHITQNFKPIT